MTKLNDELTEKVFAALKESEDEQITVENVLFPDGYNEQQQYIAEAYADELVDRKLASYITKKHWSIIKLEPKGRRFDSYRQAISLEDK